MILTQGAAGRENSIVDLFRDTFTASEGADEGALIGDVASALLAETPPEDIRVYCAEADGALIGVGVFTRLSFPDDDKTVFLLAPMAVATTCQKQGVGQRLLTVALEALGNEGVDVAVTYGDPAYYGRVGFLPITEAQAKAPLPLSFPHGWIGQSLSGGPFPDIQGPSTCVSGLNRPDVW